MVKAVDQGVTEIFISFHVQFHDQDSACFLLGPRATCGQGNPMHSIHSLSELFELAKTIQFFSPKRTVSTYIEL